MPICAKDIIATKSNILKPPYFVAMAMMEVK
jgi:hypothetical protein